MVATAQGPQVRPVIFRPPIPTPPFPPRPAVKHSVRYALRDMTVCIAGVCQLEGVFQVILCSDMRVENEHYGGDVGLKMEFVAPGWIALLAGDTAKALHLLSVFRSEFSCGKPGESLLSAESEIKRCAQLHRKSLCNDLVQSRFSISYEDFLENGKTDFTDDVYRQMLFEIQALTLECELILVSVVDKFPRLFVIHRDGSVSERRSFAAIGSGATVAESALFQRQYIDAIGLFQGVYYIYEAKRLSQIAPGVGPSTHIATIEPIIEKGKATGRAAFGEVRIEGMRYLERCYQRLALQKYRAITKGFPENFFTSSGSPQAYDGPS